MIFFLLPNENQRVYRFHAEILTEAFLKKKKKALRELAHDAAEHLEQQLY